MKKVFGTTVTSVFLVLGLTVTLTGCFGEGMNDEPSPDTETSEVQQILTNPTVVGAELPVASTVVNGVTIYTEFLGAGYPTTVELEEIQPGQVAGETLLVGDQRVVALTFTLTNTTDEDKLISDFIIGETFINDETVPTTQNIESVFSMLGGVNPPDMASVMKPGETYSWSLDALLPETLINSNSVSVKQVLTYAGIENVSNFTLNLTENLPKEESTDNGE